MVVGDDHRITGRNDVIQVNEIRQRQHDRPENQRNDDASDTLPVKIPELRAYGKQQHPRHHHEQRDAGPDETTGEYPGQKCSPVGIEPGDERVAAVRQNHQKTGDDTQQVDPADALAGGGFQVGQSFAHGSFGLISGEDTKKSGTGRHVSAAGSGFIMGKAGLPERFFRNPVFPV